MGGRAKNIGFHAGRYLQREVSSPEDAENRSLPPPGPGTVSQEQSLSSVLSNNNTTKSRYYLLHPTHNLVSQNPMMWGRCYYDVGSWRLREVHPLAQDHTAKGSEKDLNPQKASC